MFVCKAVGDFGQVVLGVGDFDVLGLGSVNCIAELPPAEEAAALGGRAILAVKTLAARCDGSHRYPVAFRKTGDARAKLMDDADEFVPYDQPWSHRVPAGQNVNIGSADGCQSNPDDGFPGTGFRDRYFFQTDVVRPVEYKGIHQTHFLTPLNII